MVSILVALCLVVIFSGSAHAYIDLGSGSYMLQLVLSSALGLFFTFRNYWKRISTYFAALVSSLV